MAATLLNTCSVFSLKNRGILKVHLSTYLRKVNNELTNNRSGTLWIRIKNLKTPLQQIDNENYNNSDVMSVKQNADNVT